MEGTPECQVKGDQSPSWLSTAQAQGGRTEEDKQGAGDWTVGDQSVTFSDGVPTCWDNALSSRCLRLNSTVGVVRVVP